MQEKNLSSGFKECEAITKKHAKTFYLASKFLNKEQRNDIYPIYAICRICDDSIDVDNQTGVDKITQMINKAYSSPILEDDVLAAFRNTIQKYNIPKELFDELIAGVKMDLTISRYETFEDLYKYCYRVASVVGLMVLPILGYKEKEAKQYAVDLGIAMQLTNILRDIKEDWQRRRLYIPLKELKQFGCSEDTIAKDKVTPEFIDLMKFQINRTRDYYQKSNKGIKLITTPRGRFVAASMKNMYSGILEKIEKNGYNVFSQRAVVSKPKKASYIIKSFFEAIK